MPPVLVVDSEQRLDRDGYAYVFGLMSVPAVIGFMVASMLHRSVSGGGSAAARAQA